MDGFDFEGWLERMREKCAGEAAEDPGPAEHEIQSVLISLGVPKRIRGQLPPAMETMAVFTVKNWAGSDSWMLVLSGPPGVGKSVAAGFWLTMTAAEHVGSRWTPPHSWWPATEIVAANYYGDEFRNLCKTDKIVLDDMGPEFSDGKGMLDAKIDRLIDARYREERKTIITTNLPLRELASRYGDRFASRIREGGRWCELPGEDLRKARPVRLERGQNG